MRIIQPICVLLLFGCGSSASQKKEASPLSTPPPVVVDNSSSGAVDSSATGELAPLQPRIVPSEQAQSLRVEGTTLVKSLAFSEGVKKLRESLVFKADQPQVRHLVVGVYMRLGRLSDARQVAEDWLRMSPDNKAAVLLTSRVLMKADRPAEGRRILERYLEKHSDDLDIRNQLARIYVLLGFHGKAIEESTTVLKADQVNVEAMTNVARVYLAQNKSELARFIIGQALEVSSTPELYHLGARVYIEAGNWQQAEAFLRKATEMDADFPEAFNNLGVVYQQVGDYQSAVVSLEQAVRVAPGYRDGFLNLGNAYRGLKEYTKSRSAYESALRIDNRYAPAYFNLGILFFENQVEGMDDERRLQLVVENFNQYKRVVGSLIPKDDPADRYIEEARRLIEEVRKAKEQELKQPAMDDGLTDPNADDGLTDPNADDGLTDPNTDDGLTDPNTDDGLTDSNTEDGQDDVNDRPAAPDDSSPSVPAEPTENTPSPQSPDDDDAPTQPTPDPVEPSTPDPVEKPVPENEPLPEKNPEKIPDSEPNQPKKAPNPTPEPTSDPLPDEDDDIAPDPEQLPEPDVPEPEPDIDDVPVPDEG